MVHALIAPTEVPHRMGKGTSRPRSRDTSSTSAGSLPPRRHRARRLRPEPAPLWTPTVSESSPSHMSVGRQDGTGQGERRKPDLQHPHSVGCGSPRPERNHRQADPGRHAPVRGRARASPCASATFIPPGAYPFFPPHARHLNVQLDVRREGGRRRLAGLARSRDQRL